MANPVKAAFLAELTRRFGTLRKLEGSESLYEVGRDPVRLYFRYSKKHPRNRTFFGLRKVDLRALEGHHGVMCFFWEGQREPLFVPFDQFEEVIAGLPTASDGQIKAQVYEQVGGTELYLANAGRFNVESYMGWDYLEATIKPVEATMPELTHNQVQTLLGGIGMTKGFDIWIPQADRVKLDWNLTTSFHPLLSLPLSLAVVKQIAEEVDVIWIDRGGERLRRCMRWSIRHRSTQDSYASMTFISCYRATAYGSASSRMTTGELSLSGNSTDQHSK